MLEGTGCAKGYRGALEGTGVCYRVQGWARGYRCARGYRGVLEGTGMC